MALDQWPILAGPEIDDGKALALGNDYQLAVRAIGVLMEVKAGAARLVGKTNDAVTS